MAVRRKNLRRSKGKVEDEEEGMRVPAALAGEK